MTDPTYDLDAILRRCAFDLATVDDDDAVTGTLDELAARLSWAIECRVAADELIDALELVLIDAMPDDVVTVAGVGVLTRSEQYRTTWVNDSSAELLRADLKRAIVAAIAVDPVTGEVDLMRQRVAQLAVDEVYGAVGSFSNVLVPARRRFRLNLDDYRTRQTYYRVRLEDEGDPR